MDGCDTAAAALHEQVSDLFADDEDGLPEVQIDGIAADEAQAMLDVLLPLGDRLRPDQTVWDEQDDEERPIAEYPDVGRLAAEGRLSTLHFVLTGICWQGVRIPDLGVSVWPGTLALDYRPGTAWTAAVLARFVDLICALRDRSEHGELLLAGEVSDPLPDHQQLRFRRAVLEYRESSA
jgi:hypothetical protein